MSSYYMWSNKDEDWIRGKDSLPLLIPEEAALHAIRNHTWTQVRFIPEERASTFEEERRAEIEREEELAAHNYHARQRQIQTYYAGTNPLD